MNNLLYDTCLGHVKDYDKYWMKRKRKINTELIFKTLICGALTNMTSFVLVHVLMDF